MNDLVVLSLHPQVKYHLFGSGMQSIKGMYREYADIFELEIQMQRGAVNIKQTFKVT